MVPDRVSIRGILVPTMAGITHSRSFIRSAVQFIKLQVAGNVLFVGAIVGTFIAQSLLAVHPLIGMVVGSALAHIVFFVINRAWVFNSSQSGKTNRQIARFVVFMSFNFLLNIVLVAVIGRMLIGVQPSIDGYEHYAALILSGLFFAVWSFVGLKFWVFTPTRNHARYSRHHALTLERTEGIDVRV